MDVASNSKIILNTQGATAYAILIPTLCIYLLSFISQQKIFNRLESRLVSVFLIKQINYILPFLLTFIIILLFVPVISESVGSFIKLIVSRVSGQDIESSYFVYNLMTHFFWLLGIHGENITLSIVDTAFYQQDILPNFTVQIFKDTFVTLGGAGSVWGLVIAILITSKDDHLKQIVKLSLPFNLFNISEILMYGIPIVLNPYFMIPFVLCPLLNFGIAYFAIDHGLIAVTGVPVSWMTPVIFSGYFVGGGSFSIMLLQLLIIFLDTLIYIPFVKMYSAANSKRFMFDQLSNKLYIGSEIENQDEKRHFYNQGKILSTHRQLKQTIDIITDGELLLHYQPKINTTTGCCSGFEALLRLKQKNGKVVGPYFLTNLEKAGFSDAIDWWVIDKVEEDIKTWRQQGFKSTVSINLNPFLLKEDSLINRLIKSFSEYNGQIEVEILETAYIKNFMLIRENIDKLKKEGINTAIDDFGTGFSSLSLLYKLNADTIKIDKSILDNAESDKGIVLYNQLCILCKQLGFKLVAEGVETKAQCEFVTQAGVNYIQGWYYAQAMPLDKAMEYAIKINSKVRPKIVI